MIVFCVMVGLSLIAPQQFLKTATKLNDLILIVFSNGFAFAAFAVLPLCRSVFGHFRFQLILIMLGVFKLKDLK